MHFLFWDRIRDWVVLVVLLVASLALMLSFNLPLVRSLRAVALDVTSRRRAAVWVATTLGVDSSPGRSS